MVKKAVAYFVHEARTYRERAGVKIKLICDESNLSRSTVNRVESDSGVSKVSAFAYIKSLRKHAPDYPHSDPFTYPKGSRVRNVKIDEEKLD